MHASRIEHTIRTVLRDITANPEFLTSSAEESVEALGLDSIGMIELVYAIEHAFGVSIGDHEVLPENFESVRALSDFIGRKMPAAETTS